jgi:S-adenosyl-L-methionine hydrolase (adenosine-forming)
LSKLPVITLTTDFGTGDGYAGSIKGAILCINPHACIVDISHSIKPHDFFQASFLIKTVFDSFPKGTIHLMVVDPGVGSSRKAIILETAGYYFVAPDNGLLTYMVGEGHPGLIHNKKAGDYDLHKVTVPKGIEVYEITNPRYWRKEVSSTFHGRDIFGPVAAHISRGVPLSEFGGKIKSIVLFNAPVLSRGRQGTIFGEVIYVDGFGNLITNIRKQDLPSRDFVIKIKAHEIRGLSKYYAEKPGLLALMGSSGHLEIAFRNGSAAQFLKAGFGAKLAVDEV